MDFCLRVSATVIALLNITQGVFCFDCLFNSIFSEIKTQNFVDDALLVQEIYSFIFLISDFCQNPSQTNSPCPHPTPQLQLP